MTITVESRSQLGASGIPRVTAAQMAEVDRLAVDEYGIGILQMMEQAGSHLAETVRLELGGDLSGRRVVVATGPGNNGGGGLAAARHLVNRGAAVRVVLARPARRSSEASRHQLATLLAMGTDCRVATYDLPDHELVAAMGSADAVVDAIVGYNLSGPPRDDVARLIGHVVEAHRPVISLDLPSGLDPDSGLVSGIAVTAAATMTLALPKPGLTVADGPRHSGRLYLADIGLPPAVYHRLGLDVGTLFAASRIVRVHQDR
ncbi:MAG: NAD(P)H-hydrate epimerase [Candidatus Limnocylindrales bacterium]